MRGIDEPQSRGAIVSSAGLKKPNRNSPPYGGKAFPARIGRMRSTGRGPHIRMQDCFSSPRPKLSLVAITMLMSSCWTAPNANLRPKGEPRVIEDSIEVEVSMRPMRVESIDRVKRILVASSTEAPTIEMKIAPRVGNLEDVHPGDQIRPKVREKLTVYVAPQPERGGSGVTGGPHVSRVLVIDPSYRLLAVQYPDGRTDTFKVGLDTRLKDMEPGDSVAVNTFEAVDLRIRHPSSRP